MNNTPWCLISCSLQCSFKNLSMFSNPCSYILLHCANAIGPGSVRVLESFGRLWEFKMPFSRTWIVLEKRNDIQNGYGKVLDFCLQKF